MHHWPIVAGIIAGAMVAFSVGLGIGWAYTGGSPYTVDVRGGAVLPLAAGKSLLVIRGPTLEDLIRNNLQSTNSSVKFSHLSVHYRTTGITVSADADVKVVAFTVPVPFETTAHPIATPNGGLQVRLSNTTAVGARLPNIVQTVVEAQVNQSIRKALPNDSYQITGIELSANGMLVYLTINTAA